MGMMNCRGHSAVSGCVGYYDWRSDICIYG